MAETEKRKKAPKASPRTCIVTGRETGTDGISIQGKRYEPGDTVEIGPDQQWMLDQGYVKVKTADFKPKPKPKAKPKPTTEEDGD